MIAVALFAILAAVVEGSFVYDYGTEMGRASEYGKVSADNVHAESPLLPFAVGLFATAKTEGLGCDFRGKNSLPDF